MLFHDQVIKWRIAKVLVYSDSVLCLGKLSDHSEANRRWEGQVADFQLSASCEEFLGIDGEPIELEWNTFTGRTSLQILQRIQNHLEKRNIEPENFGDRIIFSCQCSTTLNGQEKETKGILRNLKGKETIHFKADAWNTELLFRIIHSANQLSIYGAVSDWSEQFDLRSNERVPTSERKVLIKRRLREQRNTKEREFTVSELFGMCSKDRTLIWKQIARKSSEL